MFIVFEGLDGSGLSTQAKLLTDYLRKKRLKVILTKEPTNSVFGRMIRKELSKPSHNAKWVQTLFARDRAEHVRKIIIPALKSKKIVICDRYVLSSLAYGGIKLDFEFLKSLNKDFLKPDLTILLKVKPKICIKRIKKRKKSIEMYEHERILSKVWKNFEKLAKEDKTIKVVDGSKTKKQVSVEVRTVE